MRSLMGKSYDYNPKLEVIYNIAKGMNCSIESLLITKKYDY
jgi:hypothetical protein